MKIGLFFGTFDPIHSGHLSIGLSALKTKYIDEVWFILTPKSPFKMEQKISPKEHRLNMLDLALKEYDNLISSDIEFRLESPNYTSDTMRHIKTVYPDYKFTIIMGSDNYATIQHWKESKYILDNFEICIYKRFGYATPKLKDTLYIPGQSLNISSSDIRNNIGSLSTKKHLDSNVLEYISEHSLY